MPEIFNKTGHGLTGITVIQAKIKSVLHPEFFYADRYIHLLSGTESPPSWLGALSKILNAPTSSHERFTRDIRNWSVLNSDRSIQKIDLTNINMKGSMPHCIPRVVKR